MAVIGRPRRAAEAMSLTVSMRVTRAEYHYLQGLARRDGRSVADVLRARALVGMPPSTPANSHGGDRGPS
jgi:hypothetical protein